MDLDKASMALTAFDSCRKPTTALMITTPNITPASTYSPRPAVTAPATMRMTTSV